MSTKTKRVIVLTKAGQIIPLNVKWSERFSIPTNIKRYIKPLIGCPFIVAINRGYVWTGHENWIYQYELLPLWQNVVSMQKTNNTLWE